MQYSSEVSIRSDIHPEVTFTIARMSFARRADLMRAVRKLAQEHEFHSAGSEIRDRLDANLIAVEVERLYLTWGLLRVEGLELDGASASPVKLIEKGPEDLSREILQAIKAECGLSDAERKN